MEMNDHGIFLVHYSKAMDLYSLAININEALIAYTEEKRNNVIELEEQMLENINNVTQKLANVDFNNFSLSIHAMADFTAETSPSASGSLLYMPSSIKGDEMIFKLYTLSDLALDHRKIHPSLEQVQEQLTEVRDVTLVRGINFMQQEKVLQYHSKIALQYLERDYLEREWIAKEKAESGEDNGIPEEDDLTSIIDPRFEKYQFSTLDIPYHVDYLRKALIIDDDNFSFTLDPLKNMDDDIVVEFFKDITPPPIIPRMVREIFQTIQASWISSLTNSVHEWKAKLVEISLNHVLDDISRGPFDFSMNIADIKETAKNRFTSIGQKMNELSHSLENIMVDIGEDMFNDEKIEVLLESYEEVFGDEPFARDIIEIFKIARYSVHENVISPLMLHDPNLARKIMGEFRKELDMISEKCVFPLLENLGRALFVECSKIIGQYLNDSVLANEQGVVKEVGNRILQEFSAEYLNEVIRGLVLSLDQARGVLLDIEGIKSDIITKLDDFISNFKLSTTELIEFASQLLDEEEQDTIRPHVQKFLALKRDVSFLKDFIMQPDVYNVFMKIHSEHYYDPKSFSKHFGDLFTDEIEKLPLEWSNLAENWFAAFSNVFQIKHAQSSMTRAEIVSKFLDFIKIVSDEQGTFENTFSVISSYIATMNDTREKQLLLEFIKRFEQSQDVQEKFPRYFGKKIREALETVDLGDLLVIDTGIEEFRNKLISESIKDSLNPLSSFVNSPSRLSWRKAGVEYMLEFDLHPRNLHVDIFSSWFTQNEGI